MKRLSLERIIGNLTEAYGTKYELKAADAFNRFIPWALALHWAVNEGRFISKIQEAKDYLASPDAIEKSFMYYVKLLDWALKVKLNHRKEVVVVTHDSYGFRYLGK